MKTERGQSELAPAYLGDIFLRFVCACSFVRRESWGNTVGGEYENPKRSEESMRQRCELVGSVARQATPLSRNGAMREGEAAAAKTIEGKSISRSSVENIRPDTRDMAAEIRRRKSLRASTTTVVTVSHAPAKG